MKATSLFFNGSGTRVDIGGLGGLQIVGDQTIELWIRPASLGRRQNPYAQAYGGEGTITVEPDGSLSYYYGAGGGNATPYQGVQSGPGMAVVGEWTHIAVVRDLARKLIRWYRNGVQVAEVAAQFAEAKISNLQVTIGAGYVERFHGHIAEVRVWSVARSEAQLQRDMRRRLLGSEAGLAGYWPLDEGSGASAGDRTARANHGVISTGQWADVGPSIQPRVAALACDGASDFVELGNPAALRVTGDQTIELWIRPRRLGKRQNPLSKAYGGEGTITLEPAGSLSYYYGSAGGDLQPYQGVHSADGTIVAGRWSHIAIVRDMASKTATWYRDGVEVVKTPLQFTSVAASAQPMRIGKGYVSDFDGDIAEVRLWSVARSQAQIQGAMDRRLRGSEAGLAGYWPLDDGPGPRAADLGPNKSHGAVVNAGWTPSGPGLRAPTALQVAGDGWVDLGAGVALGGTFTQEAWIQPALADDGFHGFLGNQPAGPRSPSLWVYQKRCIHFVYGDGLGQQGGITGPVLSGEPGRWHHVAATFDGSNYRIYVDGALVHTQATGKPPAASPVKWIGRVDNTFVGAIADVRLWSVARSQADIAADMRRRLQGVEPGLVGYWPLDGASAQGLEDRGRNGAHGVLVGDAGLAVADHALAAAPSWSPVLQLAAGEIVELPDSPALVLGGAFTQEAWIQPALVDDGFHGFLGHEAAGGIPQRSPSLWVFQRRSIHFAYGDGVGQQGGITGPVLSGEPGRWHHVAATFDGTHYRIYVDGALVHTQATAKPPTASQVKWIGRVDNFFAGAIADVRLWRVARTQAEIQADMRRRLWGMETGLVGYWPLDDGGGAQARDCAGARNHGKLIGASRWRTGLALVASTEVVAGEPVVGDLPSGQSSLGGPTGPSSQTQPAALPPEVLSLAPQVDVMFVPFSLPIVFEGAVTVQPLAKAVRYSGKVTLTAPFRVTVDPLALALAAGPKWMIKFGLPQSRSITALIQTEVLAQIPGAVRPAVEAIVMPYLALYGNTTVILANEDGEDEQLGSYLAGTNVFATVNAAQVPPFNLVHATFPQLGLAARTVVLAVGATGAARQQFFVGATLMLEVELGTPLVVVESLGLSVSKAMTDTTVGAVIAFRLDLGGEVLKLRGGIEATSGVGNSVSVWGALDAADGAWKDPFGIRGLTIVGLGVQVGATPVFPFVVLGVRGEVHIGDGLLGARVGIKIDASDWSKCILDIYSEEGLDLPRLIDALTGSWLNLGSVLRVRIKELQLYVAPKGGTIAGQVYPPGLRIGGKLDLWGFQARVAGQLDFDEGGTLNGAIDPIVLSAGGVEFLRISNVAGDGGANIDVVMTRSAIGGSVDGVFSLFGGLYKSQVKASLSTSGFSATLSAGGWGIYQSASVTMESGLYRFTYGPTIAVSVTIAGYNVGLSVGTAITTQVTASSFSQGISFSFSAMGMSWSPGPFWISVPFKNIGDLAAAFYQYAKDLIVNGLLGPLVQAAQIAFDWVKTNVTAAAQEAAKFFENVGAKSVDIAKGLVNSFGVAASDAVKMLSVGAEEAAKILKDGFGWTVDQVGGWLKDVGGYADTAIDAALSGAGYAASEVADFMGDVFGGSWIPFVDLPHWDHFDLNGY